MSLDVYLVAMEPTCVFSGNTTHNLVPMAAECLVPFVSPSSGPGVTSLHRLLWRPEELQITKAEELIGPLRMALVQLKAEPARFRALNPENGWGTYDGLILFVEAYLAACEKYSSARIDISR